MMSQRGTGRLSSLAKASGRPFPFHSSPIEAKAKLQKAKEKGTARKLAGNSGLTTQCLVYRDIQDNGVRDR